MSMDARDFIEGGVVSNCCGASVMHGDMCQECGEHCEPEDENIEETYELIQFLYEAHEQLRRNFSVIRFLEWRYDLLNKFYPHKTFSVEQCSVNFFKQSLDILQGNVQVPSRKNEKGEKKSEYELNYIDWLEFHLKEIARIGLNLNEEKSR